MKKRILSLFLTLIMAMTLMPVSALADELEVTVAEIYVSSSGDDVSGKGTEDSPYATLAKAVDIAPDGATIYVMTDLSMTQCARFYDKHLTITSSGEYAVTITRGDSFETQSDDARSWYNPAMIEVQTTSSSAGLTLTNIILDDGGKHMGTVFAQASSEEDGGDNTVYVQDAIIASNATVLCTITLGEGAILRNFGGMSAVRVTNKARLVMASGSVIEDTDSLVTRTKGSVTGEVGPAGAVWIQGAAFEMKDGAKIQNVNGRAVYADSGTVTIGGTISGIKSNSKMWQGTSGTALHLRNNATGTLTATGLIENVTGTDTSNIVYLHSSAYTMDAGSIINNHAEKSADPKTHGIYSVDSKADLRNEVRINGEICGINGNPLQIANTNVYIGETGNLHNNFVNYGALYLQKNATADIYGKINNNTATGRGGGIGTAGHGFVEINLYSGSEIKNNNSNNTGGGMSLKNCRLTMFGGEISNNTSNALGGGIYLYEDASAILREGLLGNNTDNRGSNDLSITKKNNGNATNYLYISDKCSIENPAVYMESGNITVEATTGSRNLKLHNASKDSITLLTEEAQAKGWSSPLATFWAQRTGAATLTVGGLSLNNSLPVYVLTQKTGADGKPDDGAAVKVYAAAVEDGNVSFTLPTADVNGNGCAIAIVQPTDDYGTLTISGPETIKQNKTNADYPVTYTVTYTMSENLKSIIAQTGGNATYGLAVNADTRLSGTPGGFDGNSIQVTYTLPNSKFNAGDSLFTSAELTVTVGQNSYIIPSNVTETKLLGLEPFHVVFDWNDGSGKTETVSVMEGEALGDQMIANPTRSDYTFTGWNTQADGRDTAFTSATVVNSDLTVYAQWQKNSSDSDNSGSSGTPSGLNTKDHYSYIIGYQDGTLQPYGTITRGEVATIFFRLLTEETREANWSTTNNYADCSPDLWCNNAISTLTRMGIIEGFEDGTFRPNARITRAQFAKIAVGFFETTKEDYAGFFTDVNIGAWYTEYVEAAAHVGLIEGFGDGTFRPDTNITRAQACVIVNRALGRKPDEEHLLNDDEMLTWPDNNPDDWFYADMQEATNSHDYSWITVNDKDGGRVKIENWTEKLPQRDWVAFEHAWSTAYSAPGGEVTQ